MPQDDIRLVEVLALSEETTKHVRRVVESEDLDYVVSHSPTASDESARFAFPVPARSVEHVQSRLSDLQTDDTYTVVNAPEAMLSPRFKDGKPYEEVIGQAYRGISRGELRSKADDLLPPFGLYALLTVVSTIVAVAGVLLDSLAVMVGAMVIAPLIGPQMAAAVGTVVGDTKTFRESVTRQAIGLGLGVVAATAVAAVMRLAGMAGPPSTETLLSISNSAGPSALLVVVALAAGVAGALSLSTDATLELVGVMIAAAIVPPIGVVGVSLAWGTPLAALGAATVVLVNVLAVNLAGMVTLWWMGYHPTEWADLRRARNTLLIRILLLVTVTVLLARFLAVLAANGLELFP
jgi:uncharacterized hydrophobic protein (TIGR00341 family)